MTDPIDPGAPSSAPVDSTAGSSNFIRDKIARDIATQKYGGQVVTRFPPEPNGYLHIGHAKSICLNFGVAREFGGRCHLRFDDTNPTTEDMEYVESIQRDVRWLGFDWGAHLYHASDYFQKLYDFALVLIKEGKAYVESLSEEEIRAHRGTIAEPGRPSPYRDRSVQENLDLFERMRAGEFEDGAHVLRAKIDLGAKNMKMRDPLLYRIRRGAHHYRTGSTWNIYPFYDFAHCLSDAIEGITHSICTLEFENNRELYDWVLENVGIRPPRPEQTEFARLNLTYTVMSKRKLLRLVQEKLVSGWDDPRMPTISGMRRRGVTPAALRAFAEDIGVARTHNVIDIARLEHAIRDDLNREVPRVLCVLRPLKVVIENYPEGQGEELEAPFYPHDVPKQGARNLPFERELYIDRDDFQEVPPKGFFRLSPGAEVRLRYAYIIRCERVIKNDAGDIIELRCTYDPQSRGGNPADGRKVKGTIHWVSASRSVPIEVRIYDRLFLVESPDAYEGDFTEKLNPASLEVIQGARVEPSVASAQPSDRFQFERQGYFCVDPDSRPGALVFNRTVTLKDTWAKIAQRDDAKERDATAAKKMEDKAQRKQEQRSGAQSKPEQNAQTLGQKARTARIAGLGVPENEARIIGREKEMTVFFDEATAVADKPREVAKWIVNELQRELKGRLVCDLPFQGGELGQLVALVDRGEITAPAGKDVLAAMLAGEGKPDEIVERKGLRSLRDESALEAAVDQVLAEQAAEVQAYRAGKTTLLAFFIGLVMRATRGKADPQLVRQLLTRKLSA